MITARAASGRPALVASGLPENLSAGLAAELAAGGVASVGGMDAALVGLEAAVRWGRAVYGPESPEVAAVPPPATEVFHLDEAQAKARLLRWGVAAPRGLTAVAGDVGAAAREIGFPVVLKMLGSAHKTEQGGVRVGIRTPDELDEAISAMSGHGGSFLVEEMVEGAVAELLVSVRRQWPVGWLVTLGAGGTLTELVDDLAHLLAPVHPREVRETLQTLRIGPLLAGYRGAPAADLEACAAAVCALMDGALADRDVVEVEVNPLLATTSGAVAADALMSVTTEAPIVC